MALGAVIFIIGVPLSLLLKAALSRSRESLADATAVELTRNPASIRSALEKLEADTTQIRKVTTATAHMWIEAPSDKEMGLTRAFGGMLATHPPLSERIAILRRMEGLDPDERGPNDTVAVRRPLPPPNPASRWRRHP
jgi:heat shock protein HtpX